MQPTWSWPQSFLKYGVIWGTHFSRLTAVCQSTVGHFKHSVVAVGALREWQRYQNIPQHRLLQDVSTRWSEFDIPYTCMSDWLHFWSMEGSSPCCSCWSVYHQCQLNSKVKRSILCPHNPTLPPNHNSVPNACCSTTTKLLHKHEVVLCPMPASPQCTTTQSCDSHMLLHKCEVMPNMCWTTTPLL